MNFSSFCLSFEQTETFKNTSDENNYFRVGVQNDTILSVNSSSLVVCDELTYLLDMIREKLQVR